MIEGFFCLCNEHIDLKINSTPKKGYTKRLAREGANRKFQNFNLSTLHFKRKCAEIEITKFSKKNFDFCLPPKPIFDQKNTKKFAMFKGLGREAKII